MRVCVSVQSSDWTGGFTANDFPSIFIVPRLLSLQGGLINPHCKDKSICHSATFLLFKPSSAIQEFNFRTMSRGMCKLEITIPERVGQTPFGLRV